MALKVWPISDMYYPLVHNLQINSVINSFGSGYEQRIVTDFARGPRADGEGGQSKYVGQSMFTISLERLLYPFQPFSGNPNIDNSIRQLWKFYKECFYNPITGQVKWDAFYFYNLNENDNLDTWTGDVVSNGINFLGNPVTNETGRYIVRFAESNLSITRFKTCLFNTGLSFVEVAA